MESRTGTSYILSKRPTVSYRHNLSPTFVVDGLLTLGHLYVNLATQHTPSASRTMVPWRRNE